MSNHNFILRALQPSDSTALVNLVTEFDGDMTTRFMIDAYTAIVCGTEFHTLGVVVEKKGFEGLVGMGTLRFSKVQYNEEVLPLAFLDGLKVRKDFRGQGLGYQIANWRIQKARELYGDDCVIGTGMLHDNHASHAVAKKWCQEFIEPAADALIVPIRTRPPKPLDGITVREIEIQDFEEFSSRQNHYYKDHNLYSPRSPTEIANALSISPEGKTPYHYFVALDDRGNLQAGAQIWSRGMLKSDTINNPPRPLRLLNKVFSLLPSDFVIRDIVVSGLWYLPNKLNVAQYLWEMMRWHCKEFGTTIAATFDPRDPTREIVALKPWHQPRPKITIAIKGPGLIDRQKLLYTPGRV